MEKSYQLRRCQGKIAERLLGTQGMREILGFQQGLHSGATVRVGHLIYLHFGSFEIGVHQDIWLFDTVSLAWSHPEMDQFLAPLRTVFSVALKHDKAYFVGGQGEWNGNGFPNLNDVWEFDYAMHAFHPVKTTGFNLPLTCGHRSLYSVQRDEILLIGVGTQSTLPEDRLVLAITAENHVYKPRVQGKQPKLFPFCGFAETSSAAFLFGGKIFSDDVHETNQLNVLHFGEVYRWSMPKIYSQYIPRPRRSCGMALLNNKLVVYGGRNDHEYLGDLDVFDLQVLTWHSIKRSTTPASESYVGDVHLRRNGGHCMEVCEQRLLVFGGVHKCAFDVYFEIEDVSDTR